MDKNTGCVILVIAMVPLAILGAILEAVRGADPVALSVALGLAVLILAMVVLLRKRKSAEIADEENTARRRANVLDWEKAVLALARKHGGVLSVPIVVMESELTIPDAEAVLGQLAASGYAQLELREEGTIEYFFPHLQRAEPTP